jgi:hypothetical protein
LAAHAEGENLRLELETRPQGGPEGGEQSDEQRSHAARTVSVSTCNLKGQNRYRVNGRDSFSDEVKMIVRDALAGRFPVRDDAAPQ